MERGNKGNAVVGIIRVSKGQYTRKYVSILRSIIARVRLG